MALNFPGFQLYDRVGKNTAVFPLATVSYSLPAQTQVVQDAERTDFKVVDVVGPNHKGQAPDGNRGEMLEVVGTWNERRFYG